MIDDFHFFIFTLLSKFCLACLDGKAGKIIFLKEKLLNGVN